MAADYANGLYVKDAKFGTRVSIKVDTFIEELKKRKNKDGFATVEIKVTKAGDKKYAVWDNWQPGAGGNTQPKAPQRSTRPDPQDDLPF